ncbi:MAG: phage tail tape measure protein [Oscillospiraceae bacterium]
MTNLLATFRLVDEMSSKLDRIANSGAEAVEQWESAGQTADSSFGRATSGATRTAHSIDDVSSSIGDFRSSTEGAATSTDYWTDAIGNYDKEAMQAIYSTEELVEMGYKTEDALEAQSAAADETAESIGGLGSQSEQAGEQSEEFGNKSVNAVQELSKVLAAAGIARALKAVYDGFMDCGDAAAEFEVTTAQIETVADTSQVSIGGMSTAILDMSNDAGKAALGLSDAVYQAISAGVDTAHSVEFAGTANKLAVGGFTQAATAVDVLTTAINAYNLESTDADKISDMLIVTQNLGKTTVDELSSSVGRVIPLAAAYGVEMDNLSTAYAQLTVGGIATAEAGTYLKAMLSELGNSSSDVAATLQDETGQSFAMLMEQGYSLGDVLEVLGNSVGGDTTKFNELWSSTEAGVGALALFNSGSEEFNNVLGQMQNSAGATAKAYGIMADTTAHSQEKMTTAAHNVKVIIGEQLNPVLSQLYEAGASAFDWVGGFLEEHPAVTAGLVGLSIGVGVVAVALTGFALVTSPVVVTAITAITTAMLANPIFLIITGVVALTAATIAFVSILASQETEYETWTASTKKQYNELEALNKEYDEACTQYGETSEEASRLRYEMDDLNAAFEANKQTVEEFVAEIDAMAEANSKLISSYQDSITEINNHETGTFALIQKLNDLATATDQSAIAEEQMKTIIGKLNKELPGLALSYDDVTSSTEATVEALKKAAQAEADQNRFEKSREAYTELLEKQAITENEVAKAMENVRLEQDKIASDGFYTEDSLWANWTTDIDEYKEGLETAEASQAEVEAQLAEIEQQWTNIANEAAEAANASVSYEDAVTNSLDSIQGEMDELIAKYDEAYVAARDSIDGTVGLFEKAKTEAGLSSQSIIEAWQTQIDFFNQYSDNLKQLENLGVDPELLKELSDGSAESINQVQSLANELGKLDASGAEAAVDSINAKFGELSTAKDTAAATMAGIQTDFGATLDALNTKLNESIDKMNMSEEAATKAKSTMDGYINSIKSQQQNAVSAAVAVANAVSSALSTTANVKVNVGGQSAGGRGYATGTMDAEPGLHLVGENGPELVAFNGGEAVYNTTETDNIISGMAREQYNTAVPSNLDIGESRQAENSGSTNKKITLEIAGSGELSIDSSMSEEEVIAILYNHVKPVLASIIKQEIYEEGEKSYDY